MKSFVKKSLVAGLACAALVGIAVAQNYGPGMMGGYGGPGMTGPGMVGGYGYASINLTPDQQSKMLEIQKNLDQQR